MEISETPQLAVPPITWESCWWGPGCKYIKKTWPYSYPGTYTTRPNILPWGDGYRIGIELLWDGEYGRAVIYDELGKPLQVWRPAHATNCGPFTPLLGHDRVWLPIGIVPDEYVVVGGYDEIAHSAEAQAIPLFQEIGANDDLLATWTADGQYSTVYDRASGKTYTFGEPGKTVTSLPLVAGGGAFFMCMIDVVEPLACAWDRASGKFSTLIPATATHVIPAIRSDGKTLVWVRAEKPQKADGGWTSAEIWSSPFATKAADLKPTKLADAPSLGYPTTYVNDGYYSLVGDTWHVHVYRLSDMHHWATRPPIEQIGTALRVLYVDSKTVWYMNEGYVVRQDLDALGPGDPG